MLASSPVGAINAERNQRCRLCAYREGYTSAKSRPGSMMMASSPVGAIAEISRRKIRHG